MSSASAEDRKRRKQQRVAWVQRYLANPINRRLARFIPGQAVVETIGRSSGIPRPTPVGGRLEDGSFWLVSSHGRHSQYVRNIMAEPRVRVQLRGRWHAGTAHLLPDDDPRQRLAELPAYNSAMVWLLGTDLLTVRIDLDDSESFRGTGTGHSAS
jgi:deazaflavin-dependent oxidoreductase (nitroreductase family)